MTALPVSLLRWQVFSQWPDALRLVGKALDMQDPPLRHVTLASGSGQAPRQAIKLFQESETVRVFLLPMRAGAAGLTLNRGTCLAPHGCPRCLRGWRSIRACRLQASCGFSGLIGLRSVQ